MVGGGELGHQFDVDHDDDDGLKRLYERSDATNGAKLALLRTEQGRYYVGALTLPSEPFVAPDFFCQQAKKRSLGPDVFGASQAPPGRPGLFSGPGMWQIMSKSW